MPTELSAADAAAHAARVLVPGGVYVLNIGGGPDLTSVRQEVAALCEVFPHVEVMADATMLKGRRRGNVIVDVFTLRASPRVRSALDGLGSVLMGLAAALLAWRSLVGTLDAYGTGEESIILGVPIWWSMSAFAPGFALLAVVALYTAWQDFRGEGKPA